jgi:cytoskeleton protein RodZ
MNDNAYQETLFAEPLGMQLKHAREKAGLKMSDVSSQLKLPAQVVDALEREDWNALGASLYVKSYLSSYLKLLGLPPHLVNEARLSNLQAQTPVKILSTQPVRRNIDSTLMKLAYFALTAAIVALIAMLAMHFQKPRDGNQVMPLDRQATELPIDSGAATASDGETATPAATSNAAAKAPLTAATPSTPIMASMAPIAADHASNAGWTLTMNGDSWIEIVGSDGKRIDSGLISAGGQKHYALQAVTSMKIGNASAVELRRNGQVVDITAYNVDNVARFTIGADGALNKK